MSEIFKQNDEIYWPSKVANVSQDEETKQDSSRLGDAINLPAPLAIRDSSRLGDESNLLAPLALKNRGSKTSPFRDQVVLSIWIGSGNESPREEKILSVTSFPYEKSSWGVDFNFPGLGQFKVLYQADFSRIIESLRSRFRLLDLTQQETLFLKDIVINSNVSWPERARLMGISLETLRRKTRALTRKFGYPTLESLVFNLFSDKPQIPRDSLEFTEREYILAEALAQGLNFGEAALRLKLSRCQFFRVCKACLNKQRSDGFVARTNLGFLLYVMAKTKCLISFKDIDQEFDGL
ncbi:MAG: hypothetical protein LBI10_10390 [Deltaproteobacteria bacterium]|nr:hypothetical protein [Deltaproteobacteria bacterium]